MLKGSTETTQGHFRESTHVSSTEAEGERQVRVYVRATEVSSEAHFDTGYISLKDNCLLSYFSQQFYSLAHFQLYCLNDEHIKMVP